MIVAIKNIMAMMIVRDDIIDSNNEMPMVVVVIIE